MTFKVSLCRGSELRGQWSGLTLMVAVYVLLTAGVSKHGKKERLQTE